MWLLKKNNDKSKIRRVSFLRDLKAEIFECDFLKRNSDLLKVITLNQKCKCKKKKFYVFFIY